MAEPAIRIRDLVVGFGERFVLRNLSLDVRQGEILALVGGSGSGKSVLMRTIIGLVPKRRGTIEVLGTDLDQVGDDARRAIERRWGILYQQGALFSSLNLRQNVEFPMREHLKISQRLMSEVALAKLEMVGLSPEDAEKLPSELSGGMLGDALAKCLDAANDLVSRDDRVMDIRKLVIDHVQVGTADAAGRNTNEDLPRTWSRRLPLDHSEGLPRSLKRHRSHRTRLCRRDRSRALVAMGRARRHSPRLPESQASLKVIARGLRECSTC